MERNIKNKMNITKKIGTVKLENMIPTKDFKPKSIYDLKTKIPDSDVRQTIKFLIDSIRKCDIDPEVYFMLTNAKNLKGLTIALDTILHTFSTRKYDMNAWHILHVLNSLLKYS